MTKATAALAQRSLAIGYSAAIIGGVVSLILGLIVTDLTNGTPDIWIWVLIQTILGAGVILGTTFSTAAFNFAKDSGKSVGAVAGARALNLVLGAIWSAIVTLWAFAKAIDSAQKLLDYSYPQPTMRAITADSLLNDFLPAFVLIVVALVGMYLLVTGRARSSRK
ncbi:MAG: hypothetical protein ACKOWK_04440 [Micrococcales bacterium]